MRIDAAANAVVSDGRRLLAMEEWTRRRRLERCFDFTPATWGLSFKRWRDGVVMGKAGQAVDGASE
jgi:hypothetical protein